MVGLIISKVSSLILEKNMVRR